MWTATEPLPSGGRHYDARAGTMNMPAQVNMDSLLHVPAQNCTFHQMVMKCWNSPHPLLHFNIIVLINVCNHPVDVTFALEETNSTWVWEHTFVNVDETQPLNGLHPDAALHVSLETDRRGEFYILANFAIDGAIKSPFIDEEMMLPECFDQDNPNVYLPLVVFIVLLVLILVLVGLMISYRREKHRKTSQLLSDMDGPIGTHPYQEEPINDDYSDDPSHMTTTVIKNEIYRDSLIMDTDDNAGDVYRQQGAVGEPRAPIYNPKNKRKYKNKHNRRGHEQEDSREEEVILKVQSFNSHMYSTDHERY